MSKYEKMVACNRKSSADKIELAKKTIFKMLDEGEKITIPKLIAKTGLSRGFFYKNPIVRSTLDKALEQQVGMTDPPKEHSRYGDGQRNRCIILHIMSVNHSMPV